MAAANSGKAWSESDEGKLKDLATGVPRHASSVSSWVGPRMVCAARPRTSGCHSSRRISRRTTAERSLKPQ